MLHLFVVIPAAGFMFLAECLGAPASLLRAGAQPAGYPRALVLDGVATLLAEGWQLVDKYGVARPVPFVR